MRVVSVCRVLPTPDNPSAGQFVFRRLLGMAVHADVKAVQPVPFLPWVKPLPDWARSPGRMENGLDVTHAHMHYFPGVLKSLDGRWLERSVLPALRSIREGQPSTIVDAHFGYPEGVGCVRAARRLGLPVFVTLRGLEVDRLRVDGIRGQLIAALNAATGCIAVSHSLKDAVIEAGVRRDQVEVIHNAIDRETFHPDSREAARLRLDLDPGARLIVSIGNLVTLKRHTVLVEALAWLRAASNNVQLAILGGGDAEPGYAANLLSLAASLGVEGRLRIVGRVPPAEVATWLRAADVFALATSREGCCNSVLEALACGIPVVTTAVGDNARFVRAGENGFIVPVDDVESMAVHIAAAVDREWDRYAISNGLRVGTWSAVGRQVLDYFATRHDASKSKRLACA